MSNRPESFPSQPLEVQPCQMSRTHSQKTRLYRLRDQPAADSHRDSGWCMFLSRSQSSITPKPRPTCRACGLRCSSPKSCQTLALTPTAACNTHWQVPVPLSGSRHASASHDRPSCKEIMPPDLHLLDKNMAKAMTQTTSMDAVLNEQEPKIVIQRHRVDWQSLAKDVGVRAARSLQDNRSGCLYFNPAVTVSSPDPSPEFFRVVRKEQARWCRRSSSTFSKKARGSSRSWVTDEGEISNKYARYLDRALCFTGVLFNNGQLLAHHQWPRSSTGLKRPLHK
jgi:hypothetical protein